MSGQECASRAWRQVPDPALAPAGRRPLQLALPAKVATRRLPLYDACHSVMPFCGIRYRIRLGASRFPPAKKVGPMLRGMRKASSNWLGKSIIAVVMGVLIGSFRICGLNDIFKGFGQSTLATVGRTEISINEFRQNYTEKLQQIGRQFGRPLTADQARAFGLDRQLLQQTIAEAALDEEARRLGLGQSEAETMRMVVNDPNFKGVGGAFDPGRFQATIRQYGFTEQRYLADQRRGLLRRQKTAPRSSGLEKPQNVFAVLSRLPHEHH